MSIQRQIWHEIDECFVDIDITLLWTTTQEEAIKKMSYLYTQQHKWTASTLTWEHKYKAEVHI